MPSGIRVAECTCSGSTDRIRRKRAWSERREVQASQKSDWVGENSSPQVVSVAGARVMVWAGRREECTVCLGTDYRKGDRITA